MKLWNWLKALIAGEHYREIRFYADPADYICEIHRDVASFTGLSYKLKQWVPELGRYEFLGEFSYLDHVDARLRKEGISFVQVGIADLTGF